MMDSGPVRNIIEYFIKQIREIVHLVGFYYKNKKFTDVSWIPTALF
jgi:hypothetical protein